MLNWNVDGVEYNFGELLPGSIAGQVIVCQTDTVIPGVTIDLTDSTGKIVATTVTEDNGDYSFTGLRPGVYGVHEHQPAGYFDHAAYLGSGDGVVDDPNDMTRIDIGSDQHLINYDFCELLPGSIAGTVVVCDTDTVIPNVQVDLLDGAGKLVASTTTDQNGNYRFTGLQPGVYSVHEHQPAGYFQHTAFIGSGDGVVEDPDDITHIDIGSGENLVNYDFCEHVGVMLSGYVYYDHNNDGVYDRTSETPIAGVVVKLLDANGNDTGLRATTDATGFYKFNNLAAGTYSVMEIQPSGWLDGKDTPGSVGGVALPPPGDMISQITLDWTVNGTEYDFGELLPGTIAGRVVDCDDNLVIPGVQVDLLDGEGQVLATTQTDKNGAYAFTGLRPGTYSVHEHQPTQYFEHAAYLGSGDGVVVDPDDFAGIDVGSGDNLTDYVFCEAPPAQLSGYVFIDQPTIVFADTPPTPEEIFATHNGTRTPDDTPLAGVTIELRNGETGAPILVGDALPGSYAGAATDPIRVVTDANGHYHFGGLAAGLYGVIEIQPDGVTDSFDTPGTTGGFASNPTDLPSSFVAIPTVAQQAVIDQFRAEAGTDAISLIPLTAGQHSQENNFSEVQIQPEPPLTPPPPPQFPPILPPPPVPPKPPVFPPFVPSVAPLLFVPPVPVISPPDIISSSDDVNGYTWHLSVVNAGWPRSAVQTEVRYQLTATQVDVANWQNMALDQATWTLAILDGNRVTVVRTGVLGNEKAIPVTGDWNGDGVTDIGVYIDGQWFLDLNGNGRWDEGDLWARLGTQDDLPVTGDWDADGKTDIGIYGPAWSRDPWAISRTGSARRGQLPDECTAQI